MSNVYVVPGAQPNGRAPSREIYRLMGEENIFAMLADFYEELSRSEIAGIFPDDHQAASIKSAAFFVGLLGGPPLYHQTYGPPMMRARHAAFTITERGREVWLECFANTLGRAEEQYKFPSQHMEGFYNFLEDFSLWMVNSREEDAD